MLITLAADKFRGSNGKMLSRQTAVLRANDNISTGLFVVLLDVIKDNAVPIWILVWLCLDREDEIARTIRQIDIVANINLGNIAAVFIGRRVVTDKLIEPVISLWRSEFYPVITSNVALAGDI